MIDLTEQGTEGEVVDLVTRAVQSRRTTAQRLGRCAAARRRLRHRRLLNQLLGDIGQGAQTPSSSASCTMSSGRTGFLGGTASTAPGTDRTGRTCGTRSTSSSSSWTDGWATTASAGSANMYRDNAGVVEGVVTLRYGWHDVTDRPCAMAFQVGDVLMRRGCSASRSDAIGAGVHRSSTSDRDRVEQGPVCRPRLFSITGGVPVCGIGAWVRSSDERRDEAHRIPGGREGIEKAELVEPWDAVADAGHEPVLLSPETGTVQLFEHLDKADTQPVDVTVAEARRSTTTTRWCCPAGWRTRTLCGWTPTR